MKVGTKSLLFGSHQFILHPIFVAVAWRKLYGQWPRKVPIWLAFFLHDIGYWGKVDMDGEEGETHPEWGACLLSDLFDYGAWSNGEEWYIFSATHSRSYAHKIDRWSCSDLMRADKLATALYPRPLYAALCWLSGEWREYRDRWVAAGTYPGQPGDGVWAWCAHLQANWSRFKDINAVEGRAYGHE